MKNQFYPKQDYSREGQFKKTKEIEEQLDRRVQRMSPSEKITSSFTQFKLLCEEPSLIGKIKLFFNIKSRKTTNTHETISSC